MPRTSACKRPRPRRRSHVAELEYGYTGKAADRNKVLVVKAESAYAVAKERCDDKAGNAKDVCVKEAKAVETKALADAKMGKEIGEAKKDAAADKLDADYKVAIEKCDAGGRRQEQLRRGRKGEVRQELTLADGRLPAPATRPGATLSRPLGRRATIPAAADRGTPCAFRRSTAV